MRTAPGAAGELGGLDDVRWVGMQILACDCEARIRLQLLHLRIMLGASGAEMDALGPP